MRTQIPTSDELRNQAIEANRTKIVMVRPIDHHIENLEAARFAYDTHRDWIEWSVRDAYKQQREHVPEIRWTSRYAPAERLFPVVPDEINTEAISSVHVYDTVIGETCTNVHEKWVSAAWSLTELRVSAMHRVPLDILHMLEARQLLAKWLDEMAGMSGTEREVQDLVPSDIATMSVQVEFEQMQPFFGRYQDQDGQWKLGVIATTMSRAAGLLVHDHVRFSEFKRSARPLAAVPTDVPR